MTAGYSQPYGSGRGFGVNVGGRRFSMFGNMKQMATDAFKPGGAATAHHAGGGGGGGGDDDDRLGPGGFGAVGPGWVGMQERYQTGSYGFHGFYEGRNELSGITSGFDWRDMRRPGVQRGFGALFEETKAPEDMPPEAPRDWGPRQESHDISGVGPTRPMDRQASPVGGGPAGIGPRSSYDLTNARTREPAGSGVVRKGAASPGQQFAGYSGGTWPAGQIGSQPAIGSGQASLRPAYPSAIDTSSSG